MSECPIIRLAVVLLSVALFASLCINLILCFLRHKRSSRKEKSTSRHRKSLPQIEEANSGDTNNYAPEENSHGLHLEQENPIYGNITTDGTGSVVYEAMTMRARDRTEASEPDLNYASLDLKLAKRKKRHQHGQTFSPDQLQGRLTPPENAFLDEACLPLRDQSPMVSHSSIYLNSQQIDLEREDSENMHWQMTEGDKADEWSPEQSEVNVCSEDRSSTDGQYAQSDMDLIVSSHVNE